MALLQKKEPDAVILHSDRGSQYTIQEYHRFLMDHNIVSSLSAVGRCYDNAAAECFLAN